MASNKRVASPAAFALALLLLAYCTEAYVCTVRNGFYHGRCVSNRNCAHACIAEGVGTGGYCSKRRHRATGAAAADMKWWLRRPVSVCKCTVPCNGNPPSGGDPGYGGGNDPPVGGGQQQPPIGGGQPAPFAMPRTTTRASVQLN